MHSEDLSRSGRVALQQLPYEEWKMSKNRYHVYRDKPIKNVERFDKRGAASATAFKSILKSQKIEQWQ